MCRFKHQRNELSNSTYVYILGVGFTGSLATIAALTKLKVAIRHQSVNAILDGLVSLRIPYLNSKISVTVIFLHT